MPTHCPVRTGNRPLAFVRAVTVGSVLSAFLPAGTMGMADVRRDLSGQVFAAPRAQRGLPLPGSAVSVPVQLRIPVGESPQTDDFDTVGIAPRSIAGTRAAENPRQTHPVRPTVTILTPTDLAAVPAGILRVRGSVSPHGGAVRVLVNGVGAIVRSGAFSAAVRVTPHTLILSAVATTPGGLTDCHQIGLTVRATPDTRPRLRPVPDRAVVALPHRFALLSLTALPPGRPTLDGDGAGDPSAGTAGRSRFAVGRLITPYSPPPVNGALDADGVAPMNLVSAPSLLDGRGSLEESGSPETGHRMAAEAAQHPLVIHPRPEDRVEAITPNDPDASRRTLAGAGSLFPRMRGEGEVEQNPRGMPLGATYSFGLLFIFDTDGFRQVRWY